MLSFLLQFRLHLRTPRALQIPCVPFLYLSVLPYASIPSFLTLYINICINSKIMMRLLLVKVIEPPSNTPFQYAIILSVSANLY